MIVIARLPGIYGNVNCPCPRAAPSDSGRFTAINPSLEPQTPIHEERGSGNIVYNELCQTQECGATNQIASFVISVRSHDFAHIIYCAKLHCASEVGNNY